MSRYINEFADPDNKEMLSRLKSQEAAIQEKASSVKSMMLRLEGNFPAIARPLAIKPAPVDPLTLRTIDTVLTSMRNLGKGKLRVSGPHGWEESKSSLDAKLSSSANSSDAAQQQPIALTETQQYLATLRNQRSSFTRDRIQQRVETLQTMENMRQQAVHLARQQKSMSLAIKQFTHKQVKQALSRLSQLRQCHFRMSYATLRCNLRCMKRALHVMVKLLLRRSHNQLRGMIIHHKLASQRMINVFRQRYEEVHSQEVSVARGERWYQTRNLKTAVKSLLWTYTRHLHVHDKARDYAYRKAFQRVASKLKGRVAASKGFNAERYAMVIGRLYSGRSSRLILTHFMQLPSQHDDAHHNRQRTCLPTASSLLLLRLFDRMHNFTQLRLKQRKLSQQAQYHSHEKTLHSAIYKWRLFFSQRQYINQQNMKRTQVKQSRLFFQHAKAQLFSYINLWKLKIFTLKKREVAIQKKLKFVLPGVVAKKLEFLSVEKLSTLLLKSVLFAHFRRKIAELRTRKKRVLKSQKLSLKLTPKQQISLRLLFLTLRKRLRHRQNDETAKTHFRSRVRWLFIHRLQERVRLQRIIRNKSRIGSKIGSRNISQIGDKIGNKKGTKTSGKLVSKKRVLTALQVRTLQQSLTTWHTVAATKHHRKALIRNHRARSYSHLMLKCLRVWQAYPKRVKEQSVRYEQGKRYRLEKVAKQVLRKWLRVTHHVDSPSKLPSHAHNIAHRLPDKITLQQQAEDKQRVDSRSRSFDGSDSNSSIMPSAAAIQSLPSATNNSSNNNKDNKPLAVKQTTNVTDNSSSNDNWLVSRSASYDDDSNFLAQQAISNKGGKSNRLTIYKPFLRHYLKQWTANVQSVYHYNVTCYTLAQHHHIDYKLRLALTTAFKHFLDSKHSARQVMQTAERMAVRRQAKSDLKQWKERVLHTIHSQHDNYETGKMHFYRSQKAAILRAWSTYTVNKKQLQGLVRNGYKFHVRKLLLNFLLNWRKFAKFGHQLQAKNKQGKELRVKRLQRQFFETAKPFLLYRIQMTHKLTQANTQLTLTRTKTNFTLFKRKISHKISYRKMKEKARKFRGFHLLQKVFIRGLKVNYQMYLDNNETALKQSRDFHFAHATRHFFAKLKTRVLRRRNTRLVVKQHLLRSKVKFALLSLWQQAYLTRRQANKQREERGKMYHHRVQYLQCLRRWLTGMMTRRRSLLPLLPHRTGDRTALTINTTNNAGNASKLKRTNSANKVSSATAKTAANGSSGSAAGIVSQWMKQQPQQASTTRQAARNLLHSRLLLLSLQKWRHRHRLHIHPQAISLASAEHFHSHRMSASALSAWIQWMDTVQTQQTRSLQANKQHLHYSYKTGFLSLIHNYQQWRQYKVENEGFVTEKVRYLLLKWVVCATGNSHHCFFPLPLSTPSVAITEDRSCYTLFQRLQMKLKSNAVSKKGSIVLTSHRSQSKLIDHAEAHHNTSLLQSAIKLLKLKTRKQKVLRGKSSFHRAKVLLHSAIDRLVSLKHHHHLQRQLSVINHLREFHLKQAMQRLAKHKRLQLARKALLKARLLRLYQNWLTLTAKSKRLRKAVKFFTNNFHVRDVYIAFHEWKVETRIEAKLQRHLLQHNQHETEIYFSKLVHSTKLTRRRKRSYRIATITFTNMQRRELFVRLMNMLSRRYHLRDQIKMTKRYYQKQSQLLALRNLLALRRTRIATTYHKKRAFKLIKQQLRVNSVFFKYVKKRYQAADLNCVKRLFARWLAWKEKCILVKFKHGVVFAVDDVAGDAAVDSNVKPHHHHHHQQQQQQVTTVSKKIKVDLTSQYAAYYQTYGQLRLLRRLQAVRAFQPLVKTQQEHLDEYYWFMKTKRGFHKLLRATRKGIRIKKNTFLLERYHTHLMMMRAIRRWDAKLTSHLFARVQQSRLMQRHAEKMKMKRGLIALVWFNAWRKEQKHRKTAKRKAML